jgi:integrase/recombinase XerD
MENQSRRASHKDGCHNNLISFTNIEPRQKRHVMTAGIVRLTIMLEDIEPPIWRRVDVSSATTLSDLHDVIQAVMGWENAHLYQFEIGGGQLDGLDKLTLAKLIGGGIEHFRYVYDMGDDWGHALQLEPAPATDSKAVYPCFIEGKGRCPPEDVGGSPGFYHFLKVMRNTRHREHRELKEWLGESFNPNNMDTASIRRRLKELSPRPAKAKRSS